MIDGLVALLKSTPAITNLVGTAIDPVVRDIATPLPCIVYRTIGRQSNPSFDGPGLSRTRIEFTCWAVTYLAAETVRQALTALLDNYSGTLSDGTHVQSTLSLTGTDTYSGDARNFIITQEFYFFHD